MGWYVFYTNLFLHGFVKPTRQCVRSVLFLGMFVFFDLHSAIVLIFVFILSLVPFFNVFWNVSMCLFGVRGVAYVTDILTMVNFKGNF